MTATSSPPVMGLAEAAKACGVSVSTVRRKREELAAKGATFTDKGWRIPVTALIAAGLMTRTTEAPPADAPAATPDSPMTAEMEALRLQLAAAEQRAAVAEAVAAERERTIQTQAMALRMLEAGASAAKPLPPAGTPSDTPVPPAAAEPAPGQTPPESTPDTAKDGPKPVPFLRRLLGRL